VYGSDLQSVILYGSQASGEHSRKHSDYNVLAITEKIKFSNISKLSKLFNKWVRHGNKLPLFFTKAEFLQSCDIFPIEYLDMKDNHKTLFGEDPFVHLIINDKHLRHELEAELTGKLLKLRQQYMVADYKSETRRLLIGSISTFLLLFRHLIRLYGITPPLRRLDALNFLSNKLGIKSQVFITVYNIKQGDKEAKKQDPDLLMEEYIAEIEKICKIVNDLDK